MKFSSVKLLFLCSVTSHSLRRFMKKNQFSTTTVLFGFADIWITFLNSTIIARRKIFLTIQNRESYSEPCQISNKAQKMKFSVKDFFSKFDQIRHLLWIWSYLLKKSLMKNFFLVQCKMKLFAKIVNDWKLKFTKIWLFSRNSQLANTCLFTFVLDAFLNGNTLFRVIGGFTHTI